MKRKLRFTGLAGMLIYLLPFMGALILSTTSCFTGWQGDEAVLTIGLNGKAAAGRALTPWPDADPTVLDNVYYRIELTSAGGQRITLDPTEGVKSVSVSLSPGNWKIDAMAFHGDGLYAWGIQETSLAAGENRDVTVTMADYRGDGSSARPFYIYDPETLGMVGDNHSDGNGNIWGKASNSHYKLIRDITLPPAPAEGSNWTPIGDNTAPFLGVFDGNGHTIHNLTINDPGAAYQGMFGYIGTSGSVGTLTLSGVNINGGSNVGGIAGGNEGNIQNYCTVSGVVSGKNNVGGIVGHNSRSIANASFTGGSVTVNGTGAGDSIGGIAGHNTGSILVCSARGAVSGENIVGGIAGQNTGSSGVIDGAAFTGGSVTGSSGATYVGGIVGGNSNNISNAAFSGTVSGGVWAGGIAGSCDMNGRVRTCYATGAVSGNYSGGIVGQNGGGSIANCAALNESVTGTTFYRIAAQHTGTLGINYGWGDMDNDGNPATSPTVWNTGEPKNGADVDAGDSGYSDSDWWTNNAVPGFDWIFPPEDPDSRWEWDANADDGRGNRGLPVLRNMPQL